MPRELDGYRDNLEILNLRFPNYDMLTINDVSKVIGQSRNTILRHLGHKFINHRISKVYVARYMCGKAI